MSALLALGALVAVAGWVGGGGVWAAMILMAIFSVAAVGGFVWSQRSDGDLAALLGGVGDERQRSIDVRATAVSGLAMGAFCLVLALVNLARGEDNPWLVVCAVGGAAYAASLLVLRVRGQSMTTGRSPATTEEEMGRCRPRTLGRRRA